MTALLGRDVVSLVPVRLRESYAALTEGDTDRVVCSRVEVERFERMEQERLMAERLLEGWKHAPRPKDLVRRTSPELVSWDELGEDQKRKDRDAVRDLPPFLAKARFRVYRLNESASAERTDDDGNHA